VFAEAGMQLGWHWQASQRLLIFFFFTPEALLRAACAWFHL
jgi:hypothetical protein